MPLAAFDIGDSVERATNTFFAWLPALVGALAVLVIGYFVAKLIANLVGRALRGAGLDRTLQSGQTGTFVQRVTSSPSHLLSRITFWALMFGVFALAASVLGIEALESLVAAIWAYVPNVIAALLIFIVAGAIAAGVAALATRIMGDTGLGKIVATAAPILVMTIATFMILDQLMIAETIVTITYAALLGAIALGSALAFGLGGREVAARMLEGAYQKGQENKEDWKRDLDVGVGRAKDEAGAVKSKLGDDGSDATQPAETGGTGSLQGAYSAPAPPRGAAAPATPSGGVPVVPADGAPERPIGDPRDRRTS